MNINLTLVGEMITFAILVWVTMKFIWPPITKAMREREKKIADGLEAATRGEKSLELAQEKVKKQLREVKLEASGIIDQANKRVAQMLEEAKDKASLEGKKMLDLAKADIGKEMEAAKEELLNQVAALVIEIAEKVLQKNIDAKTNAELINKLLEEI